MQELINSNLITTLKPAFAAGFFMPLLAGFFTRQYLLKHITMSTDKNDLRQKPEEKKHDGEVPKTPEEKKLQQSDPQETELKGFIDPKEELEVKGTDNPF